MYYGVLAGTSTSDLFNWHYINFYVCMCLCMYVSIYLSMYVCMYGAYC